MPGSRLREMKNLCEVGFINVFTDRPARAKPRRRWLRDGFLTSSEHASTVRLVVESVARGVGKAGCLAVFDGGGGRNANVRALRVVEGSASL
jgi:hypothetical protein